MGSLSSKQQYFRHPPHMPVGIPRNTASWSCLSALVKIPCILTAPNGLSTYLPKGQTTLNPKPLSFCSTHLGYACTPQS